MFFSTAPAGFRHPAYPTAARSLERFLSEVQSARPQKSAVIEQDEKSYTLNFDMPGIGKEQLTIGIEGSG